MTEGVEASSRDPVPGEPVSREITAIDKKPNDMSKKYGK
jgi:hypothetical protein